jgi:TetR/AcrR family transcriptional regulator, tetracycline repressor protein
MARLTAQGIVDAALAIVTDDGPDQLTARRLGAALHADPTAIYRHFGTMADLLVAVGDRVLDGVCDRLPSGPPERVIELLCCRLRERAMARPRAARLIQSAPSLLDNERAITERLLTELDRLGLHGRPAVEAYHAIVELTIGSAVIDAQLAAMDPGERRATYAAWRRAYRDDAENHPHSAAVSPHLYRGDATQRFQRALRLMLRGLDAQ